jgi:hypothetical protein
MSGLAHYFSRYDHEHRHPLNKFLHGVGIPVILAGIVLAAFAHWRSGLALFVAGWLLLFLGHRIEGNRPAFFQGPIYFLVGPLWVARELKDWLRRPARAPSGPAS